jgi:multicomponent Na+:H+ antiporter subunit E
MAMAGSVLWRAVLLAGLWVIYSPEPGMAWLIGVPVVAGATWASLRLLPPRPGVFTVRLPALPVLFFVESARSATQVAYFALWPWARMAPGILRYRSARPHGRVAMAVAWIASALPGTLVGEIDDTGLTVHALDRDSDPEGEMARLERRVGWILGQRGRVDR